RTAPVAKRPQTPCALREAAGGPLRQLNHVLRSWAYGEPRDRTADLRAVFVEDVGCPAHHRFHIGLWLPVGDPGNLGASQQKAFYPQWVACAVNIGFLTHFLSPPWSPKGGMYFALSPGYSLDMPRFVLVPRYIPAEEAA